MERYVRQLALPEISFADQERLTQSRILMVGAGGLGSSVLPVLAGAGVGHISVYDDDVIDRSNLHRQTIFMDKEVGKSKVMRCVSYLNELNPDIEVIGHKKCFDFSVDVSDFDMLVDGSDNFETKQILNEVSVRYGVPLISASVQQYSGQIGFYAGYAADAPCYSCLYPELPTDACNCNDGGVLGSIVSIIGAWQAHFVLCVILGVGDLKPGTILSIDGKNMRMNRLSLSKVSDCSICISGQNNFEVFGHNKEQKMAEIISLEELNKCDHVVVDVRTDGEIEVDPITGANGAVIHMELMSVPERFEELPKDKLLAFVCAGNVRSVQAAEYLEGLGLDNICVLDKFSIPA